MIRAEEIASINPVAIDVAETLQSADRLMDTHHVHHLPVVRNQSLVGMLSARDLIGRLSDDHANQPRHAKRLPKNVDRSLQVGDVCSEALYTAPPEISLERAAWLMIQHKIHSLPLIRGGRLVAILTDTDLLLAGLRGIPRWSGPDPTRNWRSQQVVDYMTACLRTIEPEASALHAWMLMRDEEIRHLPVIANDGSLIGMISEDDVSYALREARSNPAKNSQQRSLHHWTVRDILSPRVVTIGRYDHLEVAAKMMLEHRISALVVLDYQIKGIITRTDLLKALILELGPSLS